MKRLFYSLLILLVTVTAYGQAGSLDLSFGGTGKVITPIGVGEGGEGHSIALQTDSKIVVAGYAYNGTNYDFALVRYKPDGTLDSTFGNNGIVKTFITNADDKAFTIAIQSDGKIIAAGYSANLFALVRYNSDGTLDSGFGTGGIVTTQVDNLAEINSIIIQPDGKIVAAGYTYNGTKNNMAMIRYQTDGTIDSNFGIAGFVRTSLGSLTDDRIWELALQPDGKIVAAGYSIDYNLSRDYIVTARYNINGTLDTSFNSTGIVMENIDHYNGSGGSIIIQTDGKIITGGYDSGYDSFVFARYETNGALDTTYGTLGIVNGPRGCALDLALQTDGSLVSVGIEDHHTLDVIKLVRYGINGVGDTTFGIHGIVTTPINQSSRGYSTTIQTDGKILVAGSTYDDTIWRFATVRYNPGSVGLYEITVSDGIRVFPNPTTGKITVLINQSSFTSKSVLTIYDIRGQTIWQQRIYQKKTEVDLKGLPKGIYLLKLENSGNTKIARIVKE